MLLWSGLLATAAHGQTATEDLERMTLEEMMGIEVSTVTTSTVRLTWAGVKRSGYVGRPSGHGARTPPRTIAVGVSHR